MQATEFSKLKMGDRFELSPVVVDGEIASVTFAKTSNHLAECIEVHYRPFLVGKNYSFNPSTLVYKKE